MRISYLPIFLAVASSLKAGCAAKQLIRKPGQTLLGPLLELNIAGILTSVLYTVMPSEVSGILSGNNEEVPVDPTMLRQLTSLDVLKGLGRKKRFVGRKTKTHGQPKANTQAVTKPIEEVFDGQDAHGLKPTFEWNVPYLREYSSNRFPGSARSRRVYAHKTIDRKRRSDDEEGADVQTKATETAMRGVEMMQKGLEGSKMAAEAGSDLAQSAKAGAEGLGSGADMMGGVAETMAAGTGQIQSMLPG